ncbi:hypothetical protein BH10PAT4_BH10PAT4_2320 [soil metagenome]
MDQTVIFMFAIIIIVGALLFAVIGISRKGPKNLDVDHYRRKWLSIEQQFKRDEVATYSLCVLNADKLLDQALKERGMKGETMGERMKAAKNVFSKRNNVWSAHKLRNKIAHEPDVRVTYDAARYALADLKRALKDMGAI